MPAMPMGGDVEKQGEDDQHACGSASGWAEEVVDESQLYAIHSVLLK